MDPQIVTALPQLGVAGMAIWVMYMMYKNSSERFDEKDQAFIAQVDKHEDTFKEHQQYLREVHDSTMEQLHHASKVIEDNIRAYERVINHLDSNKK